SSDVCPSDPNSTNIRTRLDFLCAEVDGLSEGLRDDARGSIEDRTREVEAGLDVGGVGGALQSQAHFVGGRDQGGPKDLEADAIEAVLLGTRGCRVLTLTQSRHVAIVP